MKPRTAGIIGTALTVSALFTASRFILSSPVWDDMNVSASAARINPATSKPDYEAFKGGTKTYLFDKATRESVTFTAQFPHGYKLGTDYVPHVHWAPVTTGGGNVVWAIGCSTSTGVSGSFGNQLWATTTAAAGTTAYKHLISNFATSSGAWNNGHSSAITCELARAGNDGSDTLDGDAALLFFDWHIQKDRLGTTNLFTD